MDNIFIGKTIVWLCKEVTFGNGRHLQLPKYILKVPYPFTLTVISWESFRCISLAKTLEHLKRRINSIRVSDADSESDSDSSFQLLYLVPLFACAKQKRLFQYVGSVHFRLLGNRRNGLIDSD